MKEVSHPLPDELGTGAPHEVLSRRGSGPTSPIEHGRKERPKIEVADGLHDVLQPEGSTSPSEHAKEDRVPKPDHKEHEVVQLKNVKDGSSLKAKKARVKVTPGDRLAGTMPRPFTYNMEPGVTYFGGGPAQEIPSWIDDAIDHRSEH